MGYNRSIIVLTLLCMSCFVMSQNSYKEFLAQHKCKWGCVISFPKKMVRFSKHSKNNMNHYFFYCNMDSVKGPCPTFAGGPIVNIDNHCSIIMEDLRDISQPHPELEMPIDEKTLGQHKTWFEGIMLNNCNLPWGQIERREEILNNDSLMRIITDARNLYVRKCTSSELLNATNVDCIYIVKIPNMGMITCRDKTLNMIIKNYTECYGVDFYRVDRYKPISMMVFIDSNTVKTIDDYVEEISRYIRFNEDFKF